MLRVQNKGLQMPARHIAEEGGRTGENSAGGGHGDVMAVRKTGRGLSGLKTEDAPGRPFCRGWVDSHTHLVFGGYRADEYATRLQGDSYMDILQPGGGILDTVRHTRALGEELFERAKGLDSSSPWGHHDRGQERLRPGLRERAQTTGGYGRIKNAAGLDVVPTFMGAHAVPPEFTGRKRRMSTSCLAEVVPGSPAAIWPCFAMCSAKRVCFPSAVQASVDKSRRIGFEIEAARRRDRPVGGAELAAEIGATSADHLLERLRRGPACHGGGGCGGHPAPGHGLQPARALRQGPLHDRCGLRGRARHRFQPGQLLLGVHSAGGGAGGALHESLAGGDRDRAHPQRGGRPGSGAGRREPGSRQTRGTWSFWKTRPTGSSPIISA